jgi:hypothetical protein
MIQMPFMLEQALVCLLQNALKILLSPDFPDDVAKRISIRVQDDTLIIANPGPALSPGLCEAINKSESPEEFEQRIGALLTQSGHGTVPGFGLVEAYCVLSQCFGGLRVKYDEPKFEIGLRHRTRTPRFLRNRQGENIVTFQIASKENTPEAASQ